MIEALNLIEKFGKIAEYWSPRVIGELNGQEVKLAKIEGEFVWHHHADQDELFYVVRGRLRMRLADGELLLEPGELCIVPRGVEHQPAADQETWIVLFEPAGTRNTGNVTEARTVERPTRI